MSSHHFVKEGQWPLNLYIHATSELIEATDALLEWSAALWCDEESEELLKIHGKLVDNVLHFERFDLSNALDVLINNNRDQVNLLIPERCLLEENIIEKIVVYLPKVSLRIYTEKDVYSFYFQKLSKWLNENDTIELSEMVKSKSLLTIDQDKFHYKVVRTGILELEFSDWIWVKESFV